MTYHDIYNGLPRIALAGHAPLIPLEKLGRRLGGIKLFMKRDDLGPIGAGGNKLRKLEFSVGNALQRGADTLITFGAIQSNHARLTAAVAAKSGLGCELILSRKVQRHGPHYEQGGNVTLNKLLGANCHVIDADMDALAYSDALVKQLVGAGRRPYVIPFGGSDGYGAVGYADCIKELIADTKSRNLELKTVVHASGSGGTQAGLIVGAAAFDSPMEIIGVSVLYTADVLSGIVEDITKQACDLIGLPMPCKDAIQVDDRFIGGGYGVLGDPVRETIEMVAREEGIILDPVYTAKAFSGLVSLARQGRFSAGETVVFLHTGGLPGVFAYADEF